MGEEVIELSIEESNALRSKLGLKPLQVAQEPVPDNRNENVGSELSLSFEESNDLRSRLGLKPLRTNEVSTNGKKASSAIHAPAENKREQEEVKLRLEEARLKREVEQGIKKFQGKTMEGGEDLNALNWAEKMRTQSNKADENTVVKSKRVKSNRATTVDKNTKYTEQDFDDQNLIVQHSLGEFSAGTSAILTLADKTILEAEEDGNNALENINMTENTTNKDNLRRKRMMEMGVGHAGGYTGYDDDEFEELGGSQMTLGITKNMSGSKTDSENHKVKAGFKLGSQSLTHLEDQSDKNDVIASLSGQKMSLESEKTDVTLQSDFMTYEEEESLNLQSFTKDEIEKRRKKKEKKLMKKLKKEHNKLTSLQQEGNPEPIHKSEPPKHGDLLNELLSNAKYDKEKKKKRKRCRELESEDSDNEEDVRKEGAKSSVLGKKQNEEEALLQQRNEKYHKIMEKGNERTNKIFELAPSTTERSKSQFEDEADDDAFLNAALSKARRIERLRELNKSAHSKLDSNISKDKGAGAVLEALQSIKKNAQSEEMQNNSQRGKKIVFDIGATTEFTRTLRSQNNDNISQRQQESTGDASNTLNDGQLKEKDPLMEKSIPLINDDGETLQDLADQVKDDHYDQSFASTANSFGVGRGMSAFLGLLKQTGEINGKNGGKEELRGRAKDERTYEDYAPLDLKNVVKIDKTGISGQPHEKDLEFANREVKLEYRDEHGRLLTRKEAYRQLCYQFHGHGASKKNEEKRLQQIERENKERSSKASTGTLHSLMATQKATGKAFVLHKT
jgi:U4/U6.U5 tri-snRNP-associated protein 1